MKKTLYDHHTEMVIDKPYNQRIKVTAVKPIYIIALSIIPWISSLVYWLTSDNANGILMFIFMYFVYFSNMMITSTIKEAYVNKRFFAFTIITTLIMCATATILGIVYFKPSEFTGVTFGMIAILSGICFIPIVIYAIIRIIITLTKNKSNCSVSVQAVCIGYESKVVSRYVTDSYIQKRERRLSPAYGDSDTVEIYTPVFQFNWNNTIINAKPIIAENRQPYVIGNYYNIYINPNNPTEMRIN